MSIIFSITVIFPFSNKSQLLRYTPSTTVRNLIDEICELILIKKESRSNYGLYMPEKKFWLDPDLPIINYEPWKNLKNVQFREMSTKSILVTYNGKDRYINQIDPSVPILRLIPWIAAAFHLESFLEHSLFLYDDPTNPLDKQKSLLGNKVDNFERERFILKPVRMTVVRPGESQWGHMTSTTVPGLVLKCIEYVEKHGLLAEGIYRISGNQTKITELKELFSKDIDGRNISLELLTSNVHDASGLLKLYLRELKEPLIPFYMYDVFIEADIKFDRIWEKMEILKVLVRCLPPANFETLKVLAKHFYHVTLRKESNHMGIENISMLIGPNILRDKDGRSIISNTGNQYNLTKIFFEEFEYLFDDVEKNYLPDFVEALYDMEEEEEGLLQFKKGDILEIITYKPDEVEDGSWWMAKDENGKKGLIPSNYVKLLRGYAPPPSKAFLSTKAKNKSSESGKKKDKATAEIQKASSIIKSNDALLDLIEMRIANLKASYEAGQME